MGEKVNEKFNEGLSILSTDDKVVIHGYRAEDDKIFNELKGLDFFDRVILAQSYAVGNLLTEDAMLLNVKNAGIKTMNWNALMEKMRKETK